MTPLLIAAGVVALVLLWGVLTFNALVRARNRVDEAWSGVDVQLKRRHDLVPNLVQTVEAYARARARDADGADGGARRRGGRDRSRVCREQAESPALRRARWRCASRRSTTPSCAPRRGFARLQAQLAEVEDEIAARAGSSTRTCSATTTWCRSFPAAVVARLGGFRAAAVLRRRDLRRAGRADAAPAAERASGGSGSQRRDRRAAERRRRRGRRRLHPRRCTCAASLRGRGVGYALVLGIVGACRGRRLAARAARDAGRRPLAVVALVLAVALRGRRTGARRRTSSSSFARAPRPRLRAATRSCCR